MAVIGKIRSYSGLLIAVIGIALAAFVLGDFMGYGPSAGSQSNELGTVGSSKIVYQEFENRVAQASENWKNQTGNLNPGPREMFQVRQQVWDQMVREILLAHEYEQLGIRISREELTDQVTGRDPHPAILQSFSNPTDGSYNPQTVREFIQNLNQMDPNMQGQWFMLEDYIREQRKETKYHNLIRKGFYAPQALARADFYEKNTMADVRVLVKRYTEISDDQVTVSDRELRNVYNEHKHKFKREAARDLEYVVFPIFPSDQDREGIRREVERLGADLQRAENVEAFINANSDERFNSFFYKRGDLSPAIDSVMFSSEVGTVVGPYVDNNAYAVAKLMEVQMRPDSMKASHILIAFAGSRAGAQTTLTRDQAKAKADSLLTVVRRSPATFANLASTVSEDPSAMTNQGDLGWFPDGAMVPGFNEAVIATPVNNFTVAESEFGYHVIQVTGKSTPVKKVQVARLTRNIEYSNQTFQRAYAQASAFSSSLRGNNDFDAVAEEQGLSKRIADDIRHMDNTIPGIEYPRSVIQWAFAERTKVGSISPIFDLDGRFVVARVAAIKEEGIPALKDIRDDIMAIAVNEKKAELLIAEFNNASGSTFDEKANALGWEVRNADNVRFNTTNLQGFGQEPQVIGSIFALQENQRSAPVKGNAGVFVVEVVNLVPAVEPTDIAVQQVQMLNTFRNRVPNEAFRALRESADIKDNRHMFY
jgi:peptidyl-prolyl cis-trans isomerase D